MDCTKELYLVKNFSYLNNKRLYIYEVDISPNNFNIEQTNKFSYLRANTYHV